MKHANLIVSGVITVAALAIAAAVEVLVSGDPTPYLNVALVAGGWLGGAATTAAATKKR